MVKKILSLIFVFSVFSSPLAIAEDAHSFWEIVVYAPQQYEATGLVEQLKGYNHRAQIRVVTSSPVSAVQFGLRLTPSDFLSLITLGVTVPGIAPGAAKMLVAVWQPEYIEEVGILDVFPRKENSPLGLFFVQREDEVFSVITACGLTHCASGNIVNSDLLPPSLKVGNNFFPFFNR